MIIRYRMFLPIFLFGILMTFPPSVFSQGKALKKIRVGVPSVSMGNIIIFVTKEAKLFEKYVSTQRSSR